MSILKLLFLTLCAFLQIKDRKRIEHSFDSVAWVITQGLDLGVLGGSKTLAWGFVIALHRLRILVSVLCLLCLCTRLFIYALWSPAWKGLTS